MDKKYRKCLDKMFKIHMELHKLVDFKGILEIGSFYHSPRVKQLGFTVFECIQSIF